MPHHTTPGDERFKRAHADLVAVSDAIRDADYNALDDADLARLLDIRQEVHTMIRSYRENQPSRENTEATDE